MKLFKKIYDIIDGFLEKESAKTTCGCSSDSKKEDSCCSDDKKEQDNSCCSQ